MSLYSILPSITFKKVIVPPCRIATWKCKRQREERVHPASTGPQLLFPSFGFDWNKGTPKAQSHFNNRFPQLTWPPSDMHRKALKPATEESHQHKGKAQLQIDERDVEQSLPEQRTKHPFPARPGSRSFHVCNSSLYTTSILIILRLLLLLLANFNFFLIDSVDVAHKALEAIDISILPVVHLRSQIHATPMVAQDGLGKDGFALWPISVVAETPQKNLRLIAHLKTPHASNHRVWPSVRLPLIDHPPDAFITIVKLFRHLPTRFFRGSCSEIVFSYRQWWQLFGWAAGLGAKDVVPFFFPLWTSSEFLSDRSTRIFRFETPNSRDLLAESIWWAPDTSHSSTSAPF